MCMRYTQTPICILMLAVLFCYSRHNSQRSNRLRDKKQLSRSPCIHETVSVRVNIITLLTRIEEVLRIAMAVKFFHELVPLEDMVEFTDANTI